MTKMVSTVNTGGRFIVAERVILVYRRDTQCTDPLILSSCYLIFLSMLSSATSCIIYSSATTIPCHFLAQDIANRNINHKQQVHVLTPRIKRHVFYSHPPCPSISGKFLRCCIARRESYGSGLWCCTFAFCESNIGEDPHSSTRYINDDTPFILVLRVVGLRTLRRRRQSWVRAGFLYPPALIPMPTLDLLNLSMKFLC